ADQIDHHRGALARSPEAQRPSWSGLEAAVAAESVVSRRGRALGALLDLLARAIAVVGEPIGVETLGGVAVQPRSLALEVRTLIPLGADPAQGVHDPVGPFGPVAFGVGVLDAQDQRAAMLRRENPVVERG